MAELEMVDICHPDVDGTTSVPKTAYEDHWVRSGWTLVDPPDERASALEILAQGGMSRAAALRVLAPESPPDPPPALEAPADQAPEAEPPGLSHAQDQPPKRRASSKED